MPLRRMPNGAYVDVPDDITPAGLAKITARYAAKPGGGSNAPEMSRREKRIAEIKGRPNSRSGFKVPGMDKLDTFTSNATHAMTLGLDDVVGPAMLAGTEGVIRAVRNRDISEIGETYGAARAAGKELRQEMNDENPVSGIAGQIAGILTNPVGAELGVAKAANAGANALTKYVPATKGAVDAARSGVAAVKASGAGRVAARMANSGIGIGARAGANQGAITALADGKSAEDVFNEAGTGALYGGAASALLGGVGKAAEIVRKHRPDQAERVAMDRIADMLERSEDPVTKAPFTGATARREIRATDKAGGDAIVADLTPEGQSWASYLAKQPGNRAAAGVINRAEERALSAADRFDARVRKQLGLSDDADDAFDTGRKIQAGRKAAAERDYSGDVMDAQLRWNDNLETFFTKDNPAVRRALRKAEDLIRSDDGDVTQLAFSKNGQSMIERPSMAVMDKVKKGFDALIGKALKDGDRETARMYSKQLRTLKDELAKENPEYAKALATQRDFFERQSSVELGESIIKRLSGSRADVKKLLGEIDAGKADDIKVGFADALMNLRTKNENPVALMRKFMRSDVQRDVLAKMFGGKRELADFERFMRRELRGAHTDAMVSSGRQMQQNLLREQPAGGDVEAVADIGKAGLQGVGFGGPLGGISRVLSGVQKWSQFLSAPAKEELSRILASKGDDLEKGLAKFKQERAREIIRARKASIAAGKAPSAVVGGYSEQ